MAPDVYPCHTCGKLIIASQIKYYTADASKVFCDAYCSFEHYKKLEESKNEESRSD